MKTPLTIFTLVFTLMFSFPSFAGWTKVGVDTDGNTWYVDFKKIRKYDGYVYYWYLSDLLKPSENGDVSSKIYQQGDCKLFRSKFLGEIYFKGPMGTGDVLHSSNKPQKEWTIPAPNSAFDTILKSVCSGWVRKWKPYSLHSAKRLMCFLEVWVLIGFWNKGDVVDCGHRFGFSFLCCDFYYFWVFSYTNRLQVWLGLDCKYTIKNIS